MFAQAMKVTPEPKRTAIQKRKQEASSTLPGGYSSRISSERLSLARLADLGVIQCDKEQEQRKKVVADILKRGKSEVSSILGLVRPYLNGDEQNLIFLAGLIKGNFNFKSLGNFLDAINKPLENRENRELQLSIARSFAKVIGFREDFTAVIGANRSNFANGRRAEFVGLAAELNVAAQIVRAGNQVTEIGEEFQYGDGEEQEVDIVASDSSQSYFVEVAATPDMLRYKINRGITGDYPQMQGYKALAKFKGVQVAYSCPTLSLSQVSQELLDRLREADLSLVFKGNFYSADELESLIEQHTNSSEKPIKKSSKSYKQTERNDRLPRLHDRGSKPSANDLLKEAIWDYEDELWAEDDFDDEY